MAYYSPPTYSASSQSNHKAFPAFAGALVGAALGVAAVGLLSGPIRWCQNSVGDKPLENRYLDDMV